MRGPKATANAMTAKVCKVMGTGQNGICVLAATVISAVPAMMVNAVCTGDVGLLSTMSAGEWVMSILSSIEIIDNKIILSIN
jgi:hypothetical protein